MIPPAFVEIWQPVLKCYLQSFEKDAQEHRKFEISKKHNKLAMVCIFEENHLTITILINQPQKCAERYTSNASYNKILIQGH